MNLRRCIPLARAHFQGQLKLLNKDNNLRREMFPPHGGDRSPKADHCQAIVLVNLSLASSDQRVGYLPPFLCAIAETLIAKAVGPPGTVWS